MCCLKIVERRGGPPCLLQKLLSWVRLAPVLGREKTSKAGKVLKISHPWQELGGEAALTEAAAVYLPHIQCQWKESYKPIQGQKIQLGVPSGSNFPIQFLPGVCKVPFDVVSLFALLWGCPRHFCWTLRSPDLMLCDLKLLFCCVLNSFTHWKLKEWQWQLILWMNITFLVCAFAMVWVYVPLRFEDDFRKPTIFLLLLLWWLEYTRTPGHRTKVQQQSHCCAILMLNKTYTRKIKC